MIKKNRIKASNDDTEYSSADIVFICSNCDFDFTNNKVKLSQYIKNIEQIAKKIKNNCLLIVQSTIPPGTTEKILEPLIKKILNKRGIKNFYLCHSFERITPGSDYYYSMKNVERIIGAKNTKSFKMTKKKFLKMCLTLSPTKLLNLTHH